MFTMPKVTLTAHQALTEVCALLSDTEGDVRDQIRSLFNCVPDADQPELKKHPLYLNLKKHMRDL